MQYTQEDKSPSFFIITHYINLPSDTELYYSFQIKSQIQNPWLYYEEENF